MSDSHATTYAKDGLPCVEVSSQKNFKGQAKPQNLRIHSDTVLLEETDIKKEIQTDLLQSPTMQEHLQEAMEAIRAGQTWHKAAPLAGESES